MAYYVGQPYRMGSIWIGAPDRELIAATYQAPDVREDVRLYLRLGASDPTVLYMGIYRDHVAVGQIMLHDIKLAPAESMVGYHLFDPQQRGRGIGTAALKLLQAYVLRETQLARLVIITGRDNLASQIIARRCGFRAEGGAREDPHNLLVFAWYRVCARG